MNRQETRPRLGLGALALLLVIATGACGNLTAGGLGEATVIISGDAPEVPAAPQAAVVSRAPAPDASAQSAIGPSSSGPAALDDDDDDPEGQLEADLTVFLLAADGTTVPMTDGEIEVRLDLEGVEEPEIGYRQVTATTYSALRMVFTDLEVQVDAGLIIDGQPISGPIDIEFDDMTLVVEKALELEIGDGERVELLIDLNADSWLQAVDPVPPYSLDAQVFADLVTVVVR